MLKTETPDSRHADLDLYPTAELVAVLVEDQTRAVEAVKLAASDIARAVDAAGHRAATATTAAADLATTAGHDRGASAPAGHDRGAATSKAAQAAA